MASTTGRYRVDVTVLPADSSGVRHAQFAIYRDDRFLEAGRTPDDPDGHWATIEGKFLARKANAYSRGEKIKPDDDEVRMRPDGPVFDGPTPPLIGR